MPPATMQAPADLPPALQLPASQIRVPAMVENRQPRCDDDKAREWLNDSNAQVDNRIAIEPDLVASPGGSGAATADNQNFNNSDPNNPDIQKYEQQQNQEQVRQQQQYMSQGSGFGGTLWTAAEWHAVDACKSVSVNQVKAYDDCVTNNFKL